MPSTRARKKQTQLGFSPLPDSSPAKSSQPMATRSRAAAVTISGSPRPRKRAKITDAFLPTPEPSSQVERVGKTHSSANQPSSAGRARSFFARGTASSPVSNAKSSDRTPSKHGELLQAFDDSESEGSEPATPNPRSRSHAKGSRDVSRGSPNARQVQKRIITVSSSDEDSDGDGTASLPARSRRRAQTSADGSEDEESDSDDQIRTPHARRRAPRVSPNNDGSGSEADSDAPQTPSKSRDISEQHLQDIQDDLEDLRSDSPPPAMRATQTSSKKTALDALRKKREKQQGRQGNGTRRAPRVISDDEDRSEGSEEEPIYADAEQQEEGYYDDEESNGFVIEDGSDDERAALPLEFRLQASKPSDLFPHVVEWMVHKRLNPAFPMEDDIYKLAFRKIDDFARGMGSSKFQSSAWTPRFSRALKARPELQESRFANNGYEHDRCDACNRSGHPATFEVQFKGAAYSKDTLEDLSDDEEDYSRDTDVPPEGTVFYIGKWCARNARTAHALTHWQRHLYDWVVDWLKDNGHLSDKAIIKRDRMKTAKRTEEANGIVDYMKDIGAIKDLHKTFKAEIETAQEQNQYSRYSSP